jgi:endonuclease-8
MRGTVRPDLGRCLTPFYRVRHVSFTNHDTEKALPRFTTAGTGRRYGVGMPEGPSIVILREEAAKFAGKRVRAVSGNSRQDIQRMDGQRLRAVCSWGKHFLLAFDGFALRVHFLLFGRWAVDARRENASPRVSLVFDNGELNLYACSVQFIEGELDAVYDWSGDVMAGAWDPAKARRKLKARPAMLAADALLEQEIFAGVGNIIKNEVLWRIRVHPESTIGALPARKLGELIKQAREYSFDFLEWKKAFVLKKHYQVHTRQYCPRDGNRLAYRKELGEKRRRAFFCEACQVLYRAEPAVAPAPRKTTRKTVRKTARKATLSRR